MPNVIKPLQLGLNQQILEQGNQFHFVLSATMGIRLSSNETLLEFDFFKEAFEHMGAKPWPDICMPKPNAEYLVSGSFYAPGSREVAAGEVRVRVGDKEKSLLVFGEREWVMGLPSRPEAITAMSLSYTNAFGGSGFEQNPDGIGYHSHRLPYLENPDQLLTSNNADIPPAGLSPLDPSLPQRMQYQGTYDDSYLEKYFPGYPADHDWRFFMTAPQDQWQEEYFTGNESFELQNLHPEKPLIKGRLPGYTPRCFIQRKLDDKKSFDELNLNLDTIWFFPGTDLALLIWRKVIDVADDEASEISNILLAYELSSESPRSREHYRAAMGKRLGSDDAFLNNFKTSDLIPNGAKCAMELLQESALADTVESPFSDNLDAKTAFVEKLVDEKLKEVNQQVQKNMEFPEKVSANEQEKINEQIDLDELLKRPGDIKPDADVEELNRKLESILPGITSGDPKKLQLKEFSFSKVDEIMAVIDEFSDRKEALAMEEKEKVKQQFEQQISDQMKDMQDLPDEEKQRVKKLLSELDGGELPQELPMPRLNMDELEQSLSKLSPQITESMQQIEAMKAMGGDDEAIIDAEKIVSDLLGQQEGDMGAMLQNAESEFKELYITGAHSQPQCVSPHKDDISVVAEKLIERIRNEQDVSNRDWACLDLSGRIFDGVDFSGAYLEQVDFSNASLKGCNFERAILARAVLNGADCRGAVFDGANLGAVAAREADFTEAQFTETILSNSDFTNSIFRSGKLENVQTIDIKMNGADFTGCNMEDMQFVQMEYENTIFANARLTASVFLQCKISNCDFSGANMPNCVWTNSAVVSCIFDGADMKSNCFAATEGETPVFENNSFQASLLERSNFSSLSMQNCSFSKALIQNANFSNANIEHGDFSNTIAKQAVFRKANVTHGNFENANVMEGIMTKARLSGASFKGANLYAVDFLRSTVGENDFSGANLDNTIIRDWQPS